MGELTAYSELGMEYIDYVRVVIRANELRAFDRVRLRPVREVQAGGEPATARSGRVRLAGMTAGARPR